MAFHQPTRQVVQRPVRPETDDREPSALTVSPLAPVISESQTWVLFSPSTEAATNTTSASYFGPIADAGPTPGRSRISDLGSLQTLARSDLASDAIDEDLHEDDAELDSLDSHLSEFRTIPNPYSHGSQHQSIAHDAPVFPSHDGLGSFRPETQLIDAEAQEHIYAFERFNPRRVKRRRESLDLAQLELENQRAQELERNQRIETWRLEQSRLLLEEVQKATRRSRQSLAIANLPTPDMTAPERDDPVLDTLGDESADVRFAGTTADWHDQDGIQTGDEPEGFWSRLTRRVIRDLMGIDDRMLSILFGEALPEDEEELSTTPRASAMPTGSGEESSVNVGLQEDTTRQLHLLERIAKELGLLVNQLSAHPGAFSTYVRVQQLPLPYAGLPVIPEAVPNTTESLANNRAADSARIIPTFRPTVGEKTQPMDIPGARPAPVLDAASSQAYIGETPRNHGMPSFTQKEWEQDLDIKLVFKYLRSRFTSRNSGAGSFTSTSHLATSSTPDAAAKAARVRQHHPLIARGSRTAERRSFRVSLPSSPVAIRHGGSCASQSTRRSARRSSISSRPSSRHFWDLGGSIGTGSIIASTGPMGSWGEV